MADSPHNAHDVTTQHRRRSPPQHNHSTSLPPPSPKKIKKTTTATTGKHPIYRGIRSRSGKWVTEIREPRKTTRVWLGTYPSPEMAAAAYDVAALALKGGSVPLNFPDRVGSFPAPSSPLPPDIQRAAAAAAEMMRPENNNQPEKCEIMTQINDDENLSGGSTNGCDHDHHDHMHDEFVDEEALFYMPNLLMDMAEGMLLSPPRMASPPSDWFLGECDIGETLWSYI